MEHLKQETASGAQEWRTAEYGCALSDLSAVLYGKQRP